MGDVMMNVRWDLWRARCGMEREAQNLSNAHTRTHTHWHREGTVPLLWIDCPIDWLERDNLAGALEELAKPSREQFSEELADASPYCCIVGSLMCFTYVL